MVDEKLDLKIYFSFRKMTQHDIRNDLKATFPECEVGLRLKQSTRVKNPFEVQVRWLII